MEVSSSIIQKIIELSIEHSIKTKKEVIYFTLSTRLIFFILVENFLPWFIFVIPHLNFDFY